MPAEPERWLSPARIRRADNAVDLEDMRETRSRIEFCEEPAVLFLFRLISGQGPGAKECIDPIQSVRL